MRQPRKVSISLLGGEEWSKLTRLQAETLMASFLSSTVNKRISLVPTFCAERGGKGLYPRDHGCDGRPRRGAGIEQDFALAITADKIACAQRVQRLMSTNRHDLPGGDADVQNAHPRILDH